MDSIASQAVICPKNHVNKHKKTMEEIIDILAFVEAFLVCFGMAYLKAIANTRQFLGLLLYHQVAITDDVRPSATLGFIQPGFTLQPRIEAVDSGIELRDVMTCAERLRGIRLALGLSFPQRLACKPFFQAVVRLDRGIERSNKGVVSLGIERNDGVLIHSEVHWTHATSSFLRSDTWIWPILSVCRLYSHPYVSSRL